MKSELIIDVRPTEASIALLEDSRLVSMQKESRDSAYSVGDIYLGKVKKLLPGLNAAFIDVGYDKEAFLHYLDLGSQFGSFKSFIEKHLDNPHLAPQLSKIKLLPDIEKPLWSCRRIQPVRTEALIMNDLPDPALRNKVHERVFGRAGGKRDI